MKSRSEELCKKKLEAFGARCYAPTAAHPRGGVLFEAPESRAALGGGALGHSSPLFASLYRCCAHAAADLTKLSAKDARPLAFDVRPDTGVLRWLGPVADGKVVDLLRPSTDAGARDVAPKYWVRPFGSQAVRGKSPERGAWGVARVVVARSDGSQRSYYQLGQIGGRSGHRYLFRAPHPERAGPPVEVAITPGSFAPALLDDDKQVPRLQWVTSAEDPEGLLRPHEPTPAPSRDLRRRLLSAEQRCRGYARDVAHDLAHTVRQAHHEVSPTLSRRVEQAARAAPPDCGAALLAALQEAKVDACRRLAAHQLTGAPGRSWRDLRAERKAVMHGSVEDALTAILTAVRATAEDSEEDAPTKRQREWRRDLLRCARVIAEHAGEASLRRLEEAEREELALGLDASDVSLAAVQEACRGTAVEKAATALRQGGTQDVEELLALLTLLDRGSGDPQKAARCRSAVEQLASDTRRFDCREVLRKELHKFSRPVAPDASLQDLAEQLVARMASEGAEAGAEASPEVEHCLAAGGQAAGAADPLSLFASCEKDEASFLLLRRFSRARSEKHGDQVRQLRKAIEEHAKTYPPEERKQCLRALRAS